MDETESFILARLQIGTATEERIYPDKDAAKVVNVKTIS